MRRPEFVARQSACPSGFLGRLIGHVMARETVEANETALRLLDLQQADHVLEVGFGHGATIARVAAAVSRGFVAGVDVSSEMCRMAGRRNRRAIASGRVELRQASAEALPFTDGAFDKVLSVHTLYFWPEPRQVFIEVRRVLKPGGCFVLGWRGDPDAVAQFPDGIYRFHTEEAVQELLLAARFRNVRLTREIRGRAILRFAIAEKPHRLTRP